MAKKGRQVPDFIEGYKHHLRFVQGPPQFKDWAALWTLSAAVERRVWTVTLGSECYCNLFILLIGPSGCGKGVTIGTSRALVASLGSDRLGASTMTGAYLQNLVKANQRNFINPETKEPAPFNAVNIISNEMAVFFPAYDTELMAGLTDMWDCKDFSSGRITEDRTFATERTCLTALFASAPVHLFELLPVTARSCGLSCREPRNTSGMLASASRINSWAK